MLHIVRLLDVLWKTDVIFMFHIFMAVSLIFFSNMLARGVLLLFREEHR